MIALPKATLSVAADLTNGQKGSRAASRLGESLGSKRLPRSGQPLDVHGIAVSEGVRIVHSSSIAESGRIEWTEDELRIALRVSDVPARQRYTVAHELGHHLIFGIEKHGRRPYSAEEERRCDRFAAALLMPKVWFSLEYQNCEESPRPEFVRKLADRFGVSLSSTLFRLHELNLSAPASLVLLLHSDDRGNYRVVAAAYDKTAFRSPMGRTASDLGLGKVLRHVKDGRLRGRETHQLYVRLPVKEKGRPRNFITRTPAVVTCVSLPSKLRGVLVDVDLEAEPQRPRLRERPAGRQAKLFEGSD